MSLPEILYCIAFVMFMLGAAWSFRSNGSMGSLQVMGFAVALDFLLTVLPIEALKFDVQGRNIAITLGAFGGMATWLLAAAAFVMKWRDAQLAFHTAIAATQVIWFLTYISFLFGIHVLPLETA